MPILPLLTLGSTIIEPLPKCKLEVILQPFLSDSLNSISVPPCRKHFGNLMVKPTCSMNSVIPDLINPMPRKENP